MSTVPAGIVDSPETLVALLKARNLSHFLLRGNGLVWPPAGLGRSLDLFRAVDFETHLQGLDERLTATVERLDEPGGPHVTLRPLTIRGGVSFTCECQVGRVRHRCVHSKILALRSLRKILDRVWGLGVYQGELSPSSEEEYDRLLDILEDVEYGYEDGLR